MVLEEAIRKYQLKARFRNDLVVNPTISSDNLNTVLKQNAEEYTQLSEWLLELKEYREKYGNLYKEDN